MPVTAPENFLTLAAASERFSVSVSTLRSWRRQQLITRYKQRDGTVMVDPTEIEKLLASRSEIIREDAGDQAAE